jgi:hypothetical protein
MAPITETHTLRATLVAPRQQHDDLVASSIAPLVRALSESSALEAVWFERVNKPDWGLRVHVAGEAAWLEITATDLVRRMLAGAEYALLAAADEPDDKWSGEALERAHLRRFHHHDTHGCLEALNAERRGALGSKAFYSVIVVERLLDLLELRGEERLRFYRRSFEWAIAAGRWDEEVLGALERTLEHQEKAITAAIDAKDPGTGQGPWPGPEAARIGRALLESIADPLRRAAIDPERSALLAARAHSNRLGLHASREAALRYLVWRTRGGERPWLP